MRTLGELYKTFGGPAKVGTAIGTSTEHAASMRRRGSIPVTYWPALIRSAQEREIEGVTNDALVAIHVPEPQQALA